MLKKILLICLIFCKIDAKILIFTHAYNRPNFIEMQYKTFKKFLLDDYEFIVWSDANNESMQQQIEAMCNKYSIRCIPIPQKIHDMPYLKRPLSGGLTEYHHPSNRNCNVVQYSLDTLGFNHDDIVVSIDSDMFLIKRFSIKTYLNGYDLAGAALWCYQQWGTHICSDHPQVEPFRYLWIGLVFLNMKTMPNKETINFNCGNLYNNIQVDAGGFTHCYLRDNKDAKLKNFYRRSLEPEKNKLPFLICKTCAMKKKPAPPCIHNTETLKKVGFEEKAIEMVQSLKLLGGRGRSIEFLVNGAFLHYRGGTNYNNMPQEYHKRKTKLLTNFIESILS